METKRLLQISFLGIFFVIISLRIPFLREFASILNFSISKHLNQFNELIELTENDQKLKRINIFLRSSLLFQFNDNRPLENEQ